MGSSSQTILARSGQYNSGILQWAIIAQPRYDPGFFSYGQYPNTPFRFGAYGGPRFFPSYPRAPYQYNGNNPNQRPTYANSQQGNQYRGPLPQRRPLQITAGNASVHRGSSGPPGRETQNDSGKKDEGNQPGRSQQWGVYRGPTTNRGSLRLRWTPKRTKVGAYQLAESNEDYEMAPLEQQWVNYEDQYTEYPETDCESTYHQDPVSYDERLTAPPRPDERDQANEEPMYDIQANWTVHPPSTVAGAKRVML